MLSTRQTYKTWQKQIVYKEWYKIYRLNSLTFICLENTFEWKQMCHVDTYMRPWYRKDLSRAQE